MARVERDIRIPVRDGHSLAADLHLPDGDARRPAILIQTPYGKEKLGSALPLPTARSWLDFWDRERQALVIVDRRGFYGSADVPAGSRKDGKDLVRWVAGQSWSDGRVAGWGPSALGRDVLRTAAHQPSELVCGVPLVCHMGQNYEDFYEQGVIREAHVRSVDQLGFGIVPKVRASPLSGTAWWEEGAEASQPTRLNVPLLFITGWYDLSIAGTIGFFDEVRRHGGARARSWSRLLVGPWHHTAIDQKRQGHIHYPGAVDAAAAATGRFLGRWLMGDGDDDGFEGRVRYWQMGEERWVDAPSFPPPDLSKQKFNLRPDGRLTGSPPAIAGERTYRQDPDDPVPTLGGSNLPLLLRAGPWDQATVEARDDVLVYSTNRLTESVALVGSAEVVLTAVTDAPDADFAVRLTDVHDDGRSMIVVDSIARATHRESTARSTPVVPGEPFEVTVRFPPTAITFLPGHRIRLSISGSNHPKFGASDVAATVHLLHGGKSRSVLTLPGPVA